jgi:phosphopantothenoylcysteine decarboxylase/phosphopantothenate--cysteine ligase
LTDAGHRVRVVPTKAALQFVGGATFEALTGAPATSEVFSRPDFTGHVELAADAELVVLAPATADLIARYAAGLADDLLTTTLLATRAPVLIAPAMHTAMLQHPATRANLETLRGRGVIILDSPCGRLAGSDSGPGRMAEPADIARAVLGLLSADSKPVAHGAKGCADRPLAGYRLLVSAGGTREPLDPVRFLGNRSSGKQGYAIAEAAVRRGATVEVVAANVCVQPPPGAEVVAVGTALELRQEMLARSAAADIVIMAAAVADFRPTEAGISKIKRGECDGFELRLVANPDILAELVAQRSEQQVLVGFAAETGDSDGTALEYAVTKAQAKGTDLTVVNVVAGGAVFGADTNDVVLLDNQGRELQRVAGSKAAVAEAIHDAAAKLLAEQYRFIRPTRSAVPFSFYLGWLAAVTGVSWCLPQVWRLLRRRDGAGVAASMWSLSLGAAIGWVSHATRMDLLNQIVTNLVVAAVALAVLIRLRQAVKYPLVRHLIEGAAVGLLLCLGEHFFGPVAFGLLVPIPTVIGAAAQGVELVRARSVKGVPILGLALGTANTAVWLVWALLVHDLGSLIACCAIEVVNLFNLIWAILRAVGLGPLTSSSIPGGRKIRASVGRVLSVRSRAGRS